MLKYINRSKTAIVLLHEIYGINQHIHYTCEKLSESGFDVFAPNMLNDNRIFNYEEEILAYNNFIKNIGFEKALNKTIHFLQSIRDSYEQIYIIGYSIGATVAWICSRERSLCDGCIGFYGSRIRDYSEINPECLVLLFFPEWEKSFNIDNLITTLNKKKNVSTEKLCGMHGFADPFSKDYYEESYVYTYRKMMQFILVNCIH